MEIREIENKDIWESFLLRCPEKTFLQSFDWGEFQKMMGNKIWRLGVYDNGELLSVCLAAEIDAKRGRFLLVQHGPSFTKATAGEALILKALLEELKKIGKAEKTDFIRIASLRKKTEENIKIFKDLGFRDSPMHASAYEDTWKLDIQPSEDELLTNMRKTTRYLIRQGMKNKDITIEKSVNSNDIELYQKLNTKVAQRQNFVPFSSEFIKNEFEVFSGNDQAMLFFGKYKGEMAAAALVIFWSGVGFYHQAASDSKYAKLSVPYLLQWEAIREAKKRGCVLYDFWGFIDPEKNPEHPWAGPTLFKIGFGGYKKEYVKTQDFPLSNKYWLTFALEKLRKVKRNL